MVGGFLIKDIVLRALKEDINYIDLAAEYAFSETDKSRAEIISKEDGIICGIDVARLCFFEIDSEIQFTAYKKDGDTVKKGDLILSVVGKTKALLAGERTAINFLQHLSGIATKTRRLSDLIKGTGAKLTDTRKTLPNLRILQKYAVKIGGGFNHRYNLSDMAMLKDNHIKAYGGIEKAVLKLRENLGHTVKIEVEVSSTEDMERAITSGADIVMLDNMNTEEMAKAAKAADKRVILEASGNITEANIKEVALTGIDIISVGELTHSVKALDLSMQFLI